MAYGFEIRNSNNQVVLDSTDTTMRIVHVQYVPYKNTTSFTVSNFDSTKGAYYVRAHLTPTYGTNPPFAGIAGWYDSVSDVNFAFPRRDNGNGNLYGYFLHCGVINTAILSWNNTSKTMSITHPGDFHTDYDSPNTTGIPPKDLGNYQVVFVEYA